MKSVEVLFLSRDDVVSLDLSIPEVVAAVESALEEHSAATCEMHPKIGVHPTGTHPANFIHAMPAYLKTAGACGIKWVGGFAANPARGLPNVTGIQVANDPDTGLPLAIMDCSHLTGLRTAAVSSIAARLCAREGARTLALAGCGFQGRMHLRFLTRLLPGIQAVRLYDVRGGSAEALAVEARAYFAGAIEVSLSAERCLTGAEVIATCTNGDDQIISAQTFSAGAFGVGIEGGCAYTAAALHSADKFLVDDVPLAEYFERIGRARVKEDGSPDPEFPGGLPRIHATLGDVLTGRVAGRQSADERIVAIPIGMSICDIALGKLVVERARKRGAGRTLPLM